MINFECFQEILRAPFDIDVLPFAPPVQGFRLREDDQSSVSVAMNQAPAGKKFNKVVCVALVLG